MPLGGGIPPRDLVVDHVLEGPRVVVSSEPGVIFSHEIDLHWEALPGPVVLGLECFHLA
jgi:hypothetical protein